MQAPTAASAPIPAQEQSSLSAGPDFALVHYKPSAEPLDPQEYYASLSRHTTLLRRPADATVLLRPAAASGTPYAYAYLEAIGGHPPRRIPLGKEPFVIGRSGEYADYHLEEDGVSRQHVEIVREDGVYAAKDLGSTNGTLWNGESMIPYRAYPLREGDCLTISRTELRFRCVETDRKTV
jgi:pSer/pThr/pTyr-binding forkhead associated (FHA) protein